LIGYLGEELRYGGARSARRRTLLCRHAAMIT
jgi:hypothetical protein